MSNQDVALYAALEKRFGPRLHDVALDLEREFRVTRHARRGPIRAYALHHSAGGGGWRVIARQHTVDNGWDSTGYSILVDAQGHVWWLAPAASTITYGSPGRAHDAVHVCALGNYDITEPPAALLDAVYGVLCALDDTLGGKPWRGHRELPRATACPGRHLLEHLKKMRGRLYGAADPRPEHYP